MKIEIKILLLLLCISVTIKAEAEVGECYSLEEMQVMLQAGDDVCGKKVCIFDLNFDFGKWHLKQEARSILDNVAHILIDYPEILLKVVGHTDSIGTEDSNEILSKNRAREVAEYLTENGVSYDSIAYDGRGETVPIDDNGTSIGRSRNRRVEIEIRYGCKEGEDDESEIEYDKYSSLSTVLPREYHKDLKTMMQPCIGDNPPYIGGRYRVTNRSYIQKSGDEEYRGNLSDIHIWFVGNLKYGGMSYYERVDNKTTVVADDIKVEGDDSCFTAYFVAENKTVGSDLYYKKAYVVTGRIIAGGITGLSVFTVMLDKYDPYDWYMRVGDIQIVVDGDGMSEQEQWEVGKPMKAVSRPKRKNKRWCPSCPQ